MLSSLIDRVCAEALPPRDVRIAVSDDDVAKLCSQWALAWIDRRAVVLHFLGGKNWYTLTMPMCRNLVVAGST